jgi:hypothetical protein
MNALGSDPTPRGQMRQEDRKAVASDAGSPVTGKEAQEEDYPPRRVTGKPL